VIRPGRAGALLAGGAASFVAAVNVARFFRPALFADPDPAWAVPRSLLWLVLVAAAAGAGVLTAAAFCAWSRSAWGHAAMRPVPLSRWALGVLAAAGILLGAAARLFWLDRVPDPLFQDEVVLVAPSLDLSGSWKDFADSIRPIPYGVKKPHGMIGVLYLETYRLALLLFGTSVAGTRSLSAIAGLVSMGTAFLLGRELFPTCGATFVLLALAGMRWHMLLSRWGWHALVVAPLLDLAAWMVLRARRRQALAVALAAGLLLGLAAHVYLAAWAAAAALVALALWPSTGSLALSRRLAMAGALVAGLLVTASPLFLLREGRVTPYFVRTGAHNVLMEVRYARSVFPVAEAAADAIASPWFVGDPEARHDLEGRSRLGWILGIPAAVALARALRFPRENFAAYLLTQSGAAFLASIATGASGHPNSVRFGYLSTVAAVVAGGGVVLLISAVSSRFRRAAAIVGAGALAIGGALAARDSILEWPARPGTDRSFHGVDTRLARAAVRWERYGAVSISKDVGVEPTTIEAVRRFRLDPDDRLSQAPASGAPARRSFRIAPSSRPPEPGERVVERVRDPRGRAEALVLARRLAG